MKKKRGELYRILIAALLCIVVLAASVSLFVYTTGDQSDRFTALLHRADELASSGDTARAQKLLLQSRRKARTVTDFLSLAKRERLLGAEMQLIDTLRKGISLFSFSPELSAFLSLVLQDANRASEAKELIPYLTTGEWASIAAVTALMSATSPLQVDPDLYLSAGESTGFPFFFRDGIVLHALAGNTALALRHFNTYRSYFQRDDLLGAFLAYDTGQYQLAVDYAGNTAFSGPESLLLSADASYLDKHTDRARDFWTAAVDQYPQFSARPYFNLSVTGENYTESRLLLEKALFLFPDYYPVIALYVALAEQAAERVGSSSQFSKVEMELQSAGFHTLRMIEKEANDPVSLEKARAVLIRARERQTSAAGISDDPSLDSRLAIEILRFQDRRQSDRLRTAGDIWKLLESYPGDELVRSYALWFFARTGSWDICFSLLETFLVESQTDSNTVMLSFYKGLQMASVGDLALAAESFGSVANDTRNAWRALANIARITQKQGDLPSAIEKFALAAQLAFDSADKSVLQYECGRLLASTRQYERARSLLGYAVELDPSNYRAAILLRELTFQ